jgi:phage I-like protein
MANDAIRLRPQLIQLSEQDGQMSAPKRIELLRAGRYEYETFFGREILTIDKPMLASMKSNYDAEIRRTKLAIDYGHESGGPAAGWIGAVELSEDGQGLFIAPEWTPPGASAVANKEYCYISAEFHLNYRDNETGKTHGPTLFGAGLTNRPFIKGMKPVELSEGAHKGDNMTQEEIKKLQDDLAAAQKQNAELGAQVKSLAEKVEATEKAKAATEKEAAFAKLLSEGKAVPAQKEAFMSGDMVKFSELAQPVKLQEQGHGRTDTGTVEASDSKSKTPAQDKVLKLARQKAKEEELSLSDAISAVLCEDSTLNAEYLKEVQV